MAKLSTGAWMRTRSALASATAEVARLKAVMDAHNQAMARERSNGRLGPQQTKVLLTLDAGYDETDWRGYAFRGLTAITGLDRRQVQRACKALRRLGYAKLEIGLWDEDGDLRGSGYRITKEGHDWIEGMIDRGQA